MQTINPCPQSKKCGGCQMQNKTYEDQLRWKEINVSRLLEKYHRVSPIIGMDNPTHYRNKVQAAFGMTKGGKIISGVYQSGTHSIVCVDECMLEDKKADEIIVTIRKLLPSFKLPAYSERSEMGFLRHVLIRRGFASGEIMVVLVTATPVFPSKNNFVKALLKLHPEITTIVQNINPAKTSLVLGKNQKVLYGKGTIEDTLCGKKFRISPASFYQINPMQTQVLYTKALELAGFSGSETIVDAYCGIGTIGIIASGSVKRVIGVELNPAAVRDAKANSALNGIKNTEFYCADAGEFMKGMASEGERVDAVILDPPRAGSDEKFLSSLVKLSPQKTVYISCNPETLERDLAYLTVHGYRVTAVQPVDMFPFTHHIEVITILEKQKDFDRSRRR